MRVDAKEPRVTAQSAAQFPASVPKRKKPVPGIVMAISVNRTEDFRRHLLWFEHPEASYLREVASVECGHLAATLQRRCPDN
jgi:hypothetical protein